MPRIPKIGDIVLVGYQVPGYEPDLVPHPAIVMKVHDPARSDSALDLVEFTTEDPCTRRPSGVSYSPALTANAWGWPEEWISQPG